MENAAPKIITKYTWFLNQPEIKEAFVDWKAPTKPNRKVGLSKESDVEFLMLGAPALACVHRRLLKIPLPSSWWN